MPNFDTVTETICQQIIDPVSQKNYMFFNIRP